MPPASTKKRASSASPSAEISNKRSLPKLSIPSGATVGSPAYSPSSLYLEGKKGETRAYVPAQWVSAYFVVLFLYELWLWYSSGFLTLPSVKLSLVVSFAAATRPPALSGFSGAPKPNASVEPHKHPSLTPPST